MSTYYKGKLHLNSELNEVKAFLASYNSNLLIGPNFKKEYFRLTPKERQFLDNYLEEIIVGSETPVTNDKFIEFLDKITNGRRIYDENCTSLDIIGNIQK